MRVSPDTPIVFTGGHKVAQEMGDLIWADLCDNIRTDLWTPLYEVADRLPCLAGYSPITRRQYLRQILKAVQQDVKERPMEYERPPFETRGKTLAWIKL